MSPNTPLSVADEAALLKECEKLQAKLRTLRFEQRAVLAEYENKLKEMRIRKVKAAL